MVFDPSLCPSLSGEEMQLVRDITEFTRQYFDDPKFDASHDFNHVLRVTAIASKILVQEQPLRLTSAHLPLYSPIIVILGALLHDVDDKKYVDVSAPGYVPGAQKELSRLGAPEELATRVQALIEAVSFSSETKNPQKVRDLLITIPELAIVQDADRLDAMGAVGIGRCFTYGAVKGSRSMTASIDHFDDKLMKLEGMMKTQTGRQLASTYTNRLMQFKSWWEEEFAFAGDGN